MDQILSNRLLGKFEFLMLADFYCICVLFAIVVDSAYQVAVY